MRLLRSQQTNCSGRFVRIGREILDTGRRKKKICHLSRLMLLLVFFFLLPCWAEFWMHNYFQPTSKTVLPEREPGEESVGPFSFPVSNTRWHVLLLCLTPKPGREKQPRVLRRTAWCCLRDALWFRVHPPSPAPPPQGQRWAACSPIPFALPPLQLPVATRSAWRKSGKTGGHCICLFKWRKVVFSLSKARRGASVAHL